MTVLVKTWTSDEIPGGLVRKTEETYFAGGNGRPPSHSISEEAIDSLLKKQKPPEPQVPSMGCSIKWLHG